MRRKSIFLLVAFAVLLIASAFDTIHCCNDTGTCFNPSPPTGTPTATSGSYAWIQALPPPGRVDTVGEWINGPFTVLLNWYGVVDEGASVVNPATAQLDLNYVFLQLSVQSQLAWQWSGFSIYDTILSDRTPISSITIDRSCAATIGGTPGYDTIFGCNRFSTITAPGMNGSAHFAPMVPFGGSVVPVNNYVINFAHRLTY